MLELAVKTLLAYLLGSLMGALIIGALRGVDIRQQGSGNAGGTNALRTQGKAFALGVVAIDIGKGWFAAGALPGLALPGVGLDAALGREWLAVSCAAAATLGHVYPVWWEFRGGKGAATLIGVVLGVAPAFLPAILAVWLLVVMATGFVGLGTILGVAALPAALAWKAPEDTPLLGFAVLMAAFVVYTHRSNIQRLLTGDENRFERAMLLRRRA